MTHSHSHSHSRGGHSHSHEESPFSETCQTPTTAATYTFVASFLAALSSISLPTHITGYFLPTVVQTVLLWSIVLTGCVYSGLTASLFFKILANAVSESYDNLSITVDFPKKSQKMTELEATRRSQRRTMKILSWTSFFSLCILGASSIVLFFLGFRMHSDEWLEFCTTRALIAWTPEESDGHSDASEHSPATADNKLELCALMKLHQTYLVLGIPCILLAIEVMRHIQTMGFVNLAFNSATRVVERPPRLDTPVLRGDAGSHDVRGGGAISRELAAVSRRRKYKRMHGGQPTEEDDDENDRLLSD